MSIMHRRLAPGRCGGKTPTWATTGILAAAALTTYRVAVEFFVLGLVVIVVYAVTAGWMAAVARRDPGRTFQIGRHGRIRRRDVTAAEWIRRYLPWGFGGGVLLVVLGLLLMSRTR